MKFLGIDIGGSFIKSAILDTDRFEVREIRKVKSPSFVINENPLIKENDPDEILEIVKKIIDSYVECRDCLNSFNNHDSRNNHDSCNNLNSRNNQDSHEKIVGVMFSTQMHGFILMDENGDAVTNYITWQDERSTELIAGSHGSYLERIKNILDKDDVRKSGSHVKPSLGMCNLYHWVCNNKQDKPLWFCTLGDYIVSKLTGEKPKCHITNAASTGMVDIEAGGWNRNIIKKLGFGNIVFPGIVHKNTVCGTYHVNELHTGGIALYPAVADHQAAMYGAFLKPGTDLAINIGTGSQISIVSNKPAFGNYEIRPFFEGKYLKAICHIPAGRALNVLISFINDIGRKVYGTEKDEGDIWVKIDSYIEKAADTDLDVNISFFRASAVPYGGAVKNINENNLTIETLFFAALKNMVQNYYDLHYRMQVTEEKIQKVVCAGGLVRKSPVLMKLIEKKFGLPCSLAPYSEDTLVGLLRIAQSL